MIQDELFKDFYSIPEGSETIVCSKCNRRLPRSSFSPESGAKYLKTVCKSCMSEYVRLLKHLRETTPPPPDDYVCPICNKNREQLTNNGRENRSLSTPWVLDHNHKTGKFRGYICQLCNRAIGCFHDNPNTLARAIKYLKNEHQRTT